MGEEGAREERDMVLELSWMRLGSHSTYDIRYGIARFMTPCGEVRPTNRGSGRFPGRRTTDLDWVGVDAQ
ncbi:hypothetical protein FFA01_21920 [Frigoribacterium faeni]|uniref:Uncharacterized protein n=1 Tax=Frigoribacterium faeni TaxID=145483 RepID=A0ABQ0URA2_9MICO|nr:hypothetical protein FFA01_21920 [Frigoribacterium faeni]